MNDSIRQAAQELAALIALSPEYSAMQEQEEAALEDETLQEEYRGYLLARQEMQELMAQDQPDQEKIQALSGQIDTWQVKLQAMDSMSQLNDARGAFSDLMEEVNAVLQGVLAPQDEEDEEGTGCGAGGCAGCHGCGSPER
ncbi:MAG: YlbF family regulator [Christensenellales bacterium]